MEAAEHHPSSLEANYSHSYPKPSLELILHSGTFCFQLLIAAVLAAVCAFKAYNPSPSRRNEEESLLQVLGSGAVLWGAMFTVIRHVAESRIDSEGHYLLVMTGCSVLIAFFVVWHQSLLHMNLYSRFLHAADCGIDQLVPMLSDKQPLVVGVGLCLWLSLWGVFRYIAMSHVMGFRDLRVKMLSVFVLLLLLVAWHAVLPRACPVRFEFM